MAYRTRSARFPRTLHPALSMPAIGDHAMTPVGPGVVLPTDNGATDVVRVRLGKSNPFHPGYCYRTETVRPIGPDDVALMLREQEGVTHVDPLRVTIGRTTYVGAAYTQTYDLDPSCRAAQERRAQGLRATAQRRAIYLLGNLPRSYVNRRAPGYLLTTPSEDARETGPSYAGAYYVGAWNAEPTEATESAVAIARTEWRAMHPFGAFFLLMPGMPTYNAGPNVGQPVPMDRLMKARVDPERRSNHPADVGHFANIRSAKLNMERRSAGEFIASILSQGDASSALLTDRAERAGGGAFLSAVRAVLLDGESHGYLTHYAHHDAQGGPRVWSLTQEGLTEATYHYPLAMLPIRVPTRIIGARVKHLGAPKSEGTVMDARVMYRACDPRHVELFVKWDGEQGTMPCGLMSVRVISDGPC